MNSAPTTPNTSKHVFEVTNYSLHRSLDPGAFLYSSTFDAGGYAWCIVFYPGGAADAPAKAWKDSGDYVAVGIVLLTQGVRVEVSFDMATGARWFGGKAEKGQLDTRGPTVSLCCLRQFRKREDLEASPYLHDDRLVIECTLTVIDGSVTDEIAVTPLPKKPKTEFKSSFQRWAMNLLLANEKPADLDGCTCRERASIRYIQSLCSSKETEGKVVFKSQRGSIAASVMRSLTLPRSVFDGPDKYIEPAIIDAYAVHVKAHTQGCRLLCPVWYGSMIVDPDKLDSCSKPEQRSFYQKFFRTFYEYDQLLVKYGVSGRHWIVAVTSTAKNEFQILNSDTYREAFKDEVEKLRNGIARMTSMARIVYPGLPNDVETWEIIEIKQVPEQTDECSCGLYVMKYMEYWDGTKMGLNFTQEKIHTFRKKVLAELLFSEFNEVTEAKEEVEKIMKLLTGPSRRKKLKNS